MCGAIVTQLRLLRPVSVTTSSCIRGATRTAQCRQQFTTVLHATYNDLAASSGSQRNMSTLTVAESCPTSTASCFPGATPACISVYNPNTAIGASSGSGPQSAISSTICCPSEWLGVVGGGSMTLTCGWHHETASWSVCHSVFQSSQVWTELGPSGNTAVAVISTYLAGDHLYYPLIPAHLVTASDECPGPTAAPAESQTLPLLPPMPRETSTAVVNGTAAVTPVPTAGTTGTHEGRAGVLAVLGCALLAGLRLGVL